MKIAPEKAENVAASLGTPSEHAGRIWTWVTGGSAVAIAAVALGLGLKAKSDHDTYFATDPVTGQYKNPGAGTGFVNMGYAATAMYCVAGALAITSVVLFFVEGRTGRDSRRAHWMAPLQGQASAASFSLRF